MERTISSSSTGLEQWTRQDGPTSLPVASVCMGEAQGWDGMRPWQAVLASVLLHAAIFALPIHEALKALPPQELQFVIEQNSPPPGEIAASGDGLPAPPPEALEEEPEPPPPPPVVEKKPEPAIVEKIVPKPPKPKVVKKPKAVKPPPKPQPAVQETSSVEAPAQTVGTGPATGVEATSNAPAGVRGGTGQAQGPVETAFGAGNGPRFIDKALPRYPRLARENGKEGTVLLRLTIDERGRLTDVEVVKGAGFGLDEAAVQAVRNSTFGPAVRDGKPVKCRASLPIRFVLKSSD
ncbi:MAG: energy transducer TonB [Syntrophobacteraceae bacterium]